MTQIIFSEQKMGELKKILTDEFMPKLQNKNIHYVDTPTHLNIGDLLIMLGTEELFSICKVKIKTVTSLRNMNILWNYNVSKDDIIICHGGGNFGDLYLGEQDHQALRLDIVKRYPNNKIIMMPQSVHFEESAKLNETLSILKGHSNLLIYVRDLESYNLLSGSLNGMVELMPDMAHMLFGNYDIDVPNSERTLTLRRRDKESNTSPQIQQDNFDWDDLFYAGDIHFYNAFRFICRIENKLKISLGSAFLWTMFSRYIARRAQAKYEGYGKIDTDRLHGAIFGLLCGRNLILRDNSYQKIARYFSKWIINS